MLKNYGEEYFAQIRGAANTRLTPDGIATWFFISFIYGGIPTGIATLVINSDKSFVHVPFTESIIHVFQVLLVIELIIAIIFLIPKVSFTFQKLGGILLPIFGIKVSIDFYIGFLALFIDKNADISILYIAGILLLGGFVLLIVTTIRAINRVKKGEFKEDGGGLFGFKNLKFSVSMFTMFGLVMFAGAVGRMVDDFAYYGSTVILLLWAALIQYIFAFALPEFFLIMYCKLKFDSFHIKPRYRRAKQNTKRKKR